MFLETELSNSKNKRLQQLTFRAQKVKKKTRSEKISGEWNFLALSLKNLLYFRRSIQIQKIKFVREFFKQNRKRKKFFIFSLTKKQNFLN